MLDVTAFLEYRLLGNTLGAWALALVVLLVTFAVLPLVRGCVIRYAQRSEQVSRLIAFELILQLIAGTTRVFLWILAIKAAENFLVLPESVQRPLTILVLAVVWFQIGLWAMAAVTFFSERQRRLHGSRDASFISSLGVVNFMAAGIIWMLVTLLILDNLGVDITALIAGLGIGGIAIALAVQAILRDLLASLAIALDKPFTVGDSIVVGDCSGRVEHIGIKSTRVRSVNGEQIILSNADALKSRVRNFGRMEERRGVMTISIARETAREKLAEIASIIEMVIRRQPDVRFDRCHFKEFAPSSFGFEAVFLALKPQMAVMMDTRQNINLQLLEEFERHGIELAYPTQKLSPSAASERNTQQEVTA